MWQRARSGPAGPAAAPLAQRALHRRRLAGGQQLSSGEEGLLSCTHVLFVLQREACDDACNICRFKGLLWHAILLYCQQGLLPQHRRRVGIPSAGRADQSTTAAAAAAAAAAGEGGGQQVFNHAVRLLGPSRLHTGMAVACGSSALGQVAPQHAAAGRWAQRMGSAVQQLQQPKHQGCAPAAGGGAEAVLPLGSGGRQQSGPAGRHSHGTEQYCAVTRSNQEARHHPQRDPISSGSPTPAAWMDSQPAGTMLVLIVGACLPDAGGQGLGKEVAVIGRPIAHKV